MLPGEGEGGVEWLTGEEGRVAARDSGAARGERGRPAPPETRE